MTEALLCDPLVLSEPLPAGMVNKQRFETSMLLTWLNGGCIIFGLTKFPLPTERTRAPKSMHVGSTRCVLFSF